MHIDRFFLYDTQTCCDRCTWPRIIKKRETKVCNDGYEEAISANDNIFFGEQLFEEPGFTNLVTISDQLMTYFGWRILISGLMTLYKPRYLALEVARLSYEITVISI
ncbi:hypothetical protein PHYBLDRAFT_60072 [Phycomyces blakesleeanus NRRL 1555(-)]|uniref:Uncharacterized protein n=1 Tax=Phycomyces blakesleeanus (strain ATCC 8743b / DSM 1359 / FGSC 10004 / NBRC 33097 / NRRL 1555) TaxID=763407 RepID=A0A163A088_PHYB8|nr:hypothetical protein PHYBLDRAFT_60072 [Phycomyces blakesleeanus NRRL 1555(-)]OAD70171.1 hypothetical protein PHYBLDRAFT_60072 [Phycomyces blakesleeanus NRRL 1555(-)]|eukprot:XP_018288211.1 hypothetical protein PHYBLDRAFT_60072 [Phycomyces blakesleeanus NRRL 1555(-)]